MHPVLNKYIIHFDISQIFTYSFYTIYSKNSLSSISIFCCPSLKPKVTHTHTTTLIVEMARSILVTGATGNQGGAVIEALLASPRSSDFTIYALTRSSNSPSAKKLAAKGKNIKLVQGDLDHVELIFQAAPEPYWGVFSMQVRLRFQLPHDCGQDKKEKTKQLY